MGKIADALNKYTKERYSDRMQKVTRNDLDALMTYDRETEHLVKYDKLTGKIDRHSLDVLKDRGTIQRLLDNDLIYPGGKLTPLGLGAVARLAKQNQPQKSSVPQDKKPVELRAKKITPPRPAVEAKQKTPNLEQLPQKEKLRVHKPETRRKPAPIIAEQKQAVIPENKPRLVKKIETIQTETAQAYEPGELTAEMPLIDVIGKEAVKEKPVATSDQPMTERARSEYSPAAIDKNLVSLLDPHSYEAEQFKILRTNILYPISGKPPRSVLVTSAFPSEGKSFVASNLAISIALNINKHVLLMDCDLRKPELHSRFGFRTASGLSNYLSNGDSLESLLLKTEVNKLTILPGGPTPANPSELMTSNRMEALIEEVRSRYQDRLIIIDAPPPSMAAETGFLSRQVDGIILVVNCGKTPKDQIRNLIESLGTDKIVGSVINNVDPNSMKYYSYKKYSKYGKRYKK